MCYYIEILSEHIHVGVYRTSQTRSSSQGPTPAVAPFTPVSCPSPFPSESPLAPASPPSLARIPGPVAPQFSLSPVIPVPSLGFRSRAGGEERDRSPSCSSELLQTTLPLPSVSKGGCGSWYIGVGGLSGVASLDGSTDLSDTSDYESSIRDAGSAAAPCGTISVTLSA